MKVNKLLYIVGFVMQAILPILLFGIAVPYWHGEMAAGFTKIGYVALIIIGLILIHKIKAQIKKKPISLSRGIVLYFGFPLIIWGALGLGINFLKTFVQNLLRFWWLTGAFLALGGLCYLIADLLTDMEANNG
jgi:hypothetical protein